MSHASTSTMNCCNMQLLQILRTGAVVNLFLMPVLPQVASERASGWRSGRWAGQRWSYSYWWIYDKSQEIPGSCFRDSGGGQSATACTLEGSILMFLDVTIKARKDTEATWKSHLSALKYSCFFLRHWRIDWTAWPVKTSFTMPWNIAGAFVSLKGITRYS